MVQTTLGLVLYNWWKLQAIVYAFSLPHSWTQLVQFGFTMLLLLFLLFCYLLFLLLPKTDFGQLASLAQLLLLIDYHLWVYRPAFNVEIGWAMHSFIINSWTVNKCCLFWGNKFKFYGVKYINGESFHFEFQIHFVSSSWNANSVCKNFERVSAKAKKKSLKIFMKVNLVIMICFIGIILSYS